MLDISVENITNVAGGLRINTNHRVLVCFYASPSIETIHEKLFSVLDRIDNKFIIVGKVKVNVLNINYVQNVIKIKHIPTFIIFNRGIAFSDFNGDWHDKNDIEKFIKASV